MPPEMLPDADARWRLGVYAAPAPDSPLGDRAARWLGRHLDVSASDRQEPEPASTALGADALRELTVAPRLYGFHATLKAPFHLGDGVDPCAVDAAVADLARSLAPVVIPELVPTVVRGCAVVVPAEVPAALLDLERRCVTDLDRFRRPLDEMGLARRRRAELSERQDELLLAYGYPWSLDEFEFHMTLSRQLAPAEVAPVLDAVVVWFEPVLAEPYVVDDLCVVVQAAPGEPFTVVSRHPLTGSAREAQG